MNNDKPLSQAHFNTEEIFSLSKAEIKKLVADSKTAPGGVLRICLHDSPENKLHQMLIVHQRDHYVRPHKHLNAKPESFHIVEGDLDVFIFDDQGKITQKIEMGSYESGKKFCYRLSGERFHTVLPRSEHVVFHEITGGPFVRAETLFPEWAPDKAENPQAQEFINKLKSWR